MTKKLNKRYSTFILFCFAMLCATNLTIAQQITTDGTLALNDLIQNNLADGCVEISNVSSSVNGSVNSINSFGLFNKAGSNFPFDSGIILTSGNVAEAGNTQITTALNSGTAAWGNDPDLNTALGNTETYLNATSIQFDFISGTDQVQFNYILASEEYFGTNPCVYSDGFAFLIKETGTTNPFTNIAIIPGTTIPVNTTTVHSEIVGNNGCPAANEQFFEGINIGDTNYNGRTTVLTASAPITANVSYTIKLIIADARDSFYDSAVFIQANSFDNSVDLGPDISTCDSSVTLNGTIPSNNASYSWSLNGTPVATLNNMPVINVNQPGIYTVEVSIPLNGSTCTFSDTVEVRLNNIQTGPTLTDIALCDDPSNNAIADFNFSSAETELTGLLPQPETYTISYHNNSTDAGNGNSPIGNTTTYPNTSTPEQIFVRAVNSAGCVYVSSFNLVVNEFPTVTDPTDDFIICANSGGANLTTLNDGITGSNASYNVTYHNSLSDSQTGNSPLTMPYTPAANPETVFIRIQTSAGCFTTADVNVTVNQNPVINTDVQQIDACEQDNDGFEAFDITSVEADILMGLTGVTISYHENAPDSETGANPIADPTNYTNIVQSVQIVYIRIVDDVTGCVTIHPIELHTQLLHTGTAFSITPDNIVEFGECDNDFNGSVEFDLTEVAGSILNNVENTSVQFFENDPVANPTEPEINQAVPYVINGDTILFVTLTETNPDCVYNNQITLVVFEGIAITPLTVQDYCDSDNDITNVTVDFSTFSPYLNSQVTATGSFIFAFYPSQLDAEGDTSRYLTVQDFMPTTNPFSVYVRVSNQVTGCFAIEELPINVLPAPSANTPTSSLTTCSTTNTIDLTDIIPQINNNPLVSYSFFESLVDAQSNNSPISTPTTYNSTTRTLYARLVNANNCFAIQAFDVVFNDKPQVTIEDYVLCLDFNATSNSVEFQYEMTIDPIIMNPALPNSDSNITSAVTTSYFENYDSTTGVLSNPINKTQPDVRTSPTDTEIYVLVEYINDPTCFSVIPFKIKIGTNPHYNTSYGSLEVCDDTSNNGIAIFNLANFTTVLEQGSSQTLTINYYENQQDALNNNVAASIQNITNFQNTSNPQTLFFNIDNGTICNGVDSFEILVNPVPSGITPAPLRVCDTDLDGRMPFDLTSVEAAVLANLGVRQNAILNYFPTQTDYDNGNNQIPTSNTTNYTNISNPQTVIIQVLNTTTNCFDTVELVLNVDVPPTITSTTIEICDNATKQYDLNEAVDALIGTQTNVNIEFYNSLADAQSQTGELPLLYNYTSNSTTLYARANFGGSNCFYINSFRLNINSLPSLNPPANIIVCDTDFDLMEPFDISSKAQEAIGSQNPANFILSYHNTQVDADTNTDPITNLSFIGTTRSYFIRVESTITGCVATTTFQTVVNRKPTVELNDAALCIDNLPFVANAGTGVSTDTYLWSTGETTSSININSIGTYSVTITTANGCTNSDSFSLVESESATIEFTQTVDFSSPNNSITVDVSGIGDYLFQLDGGAPQTSNFFDNVSYGVHLITVIDELGCNSVTKEVLIFDIPPFFTPNGDGYNDTWHVSGVTELKGTIIYIFDRYGKLLKTLLHTSKGWDGTYNGHNMPTSDYWYVANIKQGEKEFELKGHFTLKR